MADRVGQQFGNYRLTRLLGHGGFAEVYLGEHVYLSTQAAVKILQTQLARDQKEQFRAELDFVQFSLRNRQPAQAGSTQHVTLNRHRGEKPMSEKSSHPTDVDARWQGHH